jgi:CheY-like chemotaxis protein
LPTILVADDNSNIQKMVILAFKGEGIDVVAVGNGEAAVKKTIEIVPDLVLADIFMPVRSGYEVCEFLKQDSRFSHVPVVLLAGAFDPFDEKEAQRVGADGVLKKPFVPPDPLVALVKGLLTRNVERLVAVSAPAQTTTVSAQSSEATPDASASSVPAFTPPEVVPPPFVPASPDAGAKEDKYADDDAESTTTIAPMRDFAIPVAPPEPVHHGNSDAFGSMMDTSPLGAVMPSTRELIESEAEQEVGEDREIQPASAHTAFEGFSPWRASAASAGVVEEEEAPAHHADPSNQVTPSSKDLMGRSWDQEPALEDRSPDETVIEPLEGISPLTHSARHVTNTHQDVSDIAETPAAETNIVAEQSEVAEQSAAQNGQPEPSQSSGVSDWRSAFTQAPEEATKIVETPVPSMAPWRMSTSPVESDKRDNFAEPASFSDDLKSPAVHSLSDTVIESEPSVFAAYQSENDSAKSTEAEASAEGTAHVVEDIAPLVAHTEPVTAPSMEVAEQTAAEETKESASPETRADAETSDWIAELPAHLSPEDTTAVARSVVEQLAPGAVESVTSSFPVSTGGTSDPRVVEDIVSRVVGRMQPQILEIITREVLRPVVEALVRRQLEQKSSE